jgi:hypothetical protein
MHQAEQATSPVGWRNGQKLDSVAAGYVQALYAAEGTIFCHVIDIFDDFLMV